MTSSLRSAVEMLADLDREKASHASTRATLAQHVDENLDLHRRVADLEAKVTKALKRLDDIGRNEPIRQDLEGILRG